jgi:hypothetical protein
LAYPASLSVVVRLLASNRRHLASSADCYERGRSVPAIFGLRVAPAHDKLRSGPNSSERESTSARSTDYGNGHLIRVFRDIGRIVSLLFLLSHPSPVGHQLMKRVQTGRPNLVSSKAKTVSFVFLAELRAAPGCPFARTKTPPQSDRFVCAMDTRSLSNVPSEFPQLVLRQGPGRL